MSMGKIPRNATAKLALSIGVPMLEDSVPADELRCKVGHDRLEILGQQHPAEDFYRQKRASLGEIVFPDRHPDTEPVAGQTSTGEPAGICGELGLSVKY